MIRGTQKLTELALTMKDELIRTDKDHVVYLRLNRPDKLNTLSENVIGRLEQEIESINADPDVRCVVISAEGRAFCAGHDSATAGVEQNRPRLMPGTANLARLPAMARSQLATN